MLQRRGLNPGLPGNSGSECPPESTCRLSVQSGPLRPVKRFQQKMIQHESGIERGIAEMYHFKIDRNHPGPIHQEVFRTPVAVGEAHAPAS